MSSYEASPSEQIDNIISNTPGWRGDMLAKLRTAITQVEPAVVEEVKWKKPSRPEGIPVWTYNDKNVCMADILKNAVRLTFPKGTQMSDPHKLFNTRLDSKTVRAIDFYEGTNVDVSALQQLVAEAAQLN